MHFLQSIALFFLSSKTLVAILSLPILTPTMHVFQLNALFTYMFMLWCFGVIWILSYFPKGILGSCTRWVQGFYLIVTFLVYRNIWAYKNERYAQKCFPVAIAGYALVSLAQISACFYFASHLGAFIEPRGNAQAMLVLLIPSLPLGFFGFAISFYCNLKINVPYTFYKRVEYYSLFPIYATLGLLLSSYALYFILSESDVIFRHDAVTTHSAIILGSILIIMGFIHFRTELFFAAFWSLAVAGLIYIKMAGKMAYYGIQKTDLNNLKGEYWFVVFHVTTIVIFIVTGMIMCLYVNERPRVHEKSVDKHKVFVLNNESLPFTVCQKC